MAFVLWHLDQSQFAAEYIGLLLTQSDAVNLAFAMHR